MSKYGKLSFPPLNDIYSISSYLEIQRRLIQTKANCKIFYSVWKETSHRPLKVAAAKKSFPRFGTTAMLLRSLKQMFWKKSVFYICYLHNNITTLLIPKVQNKTSTSWMFLLKFICWYLLSLFQFANV